MPVNYSSETDFTLGTAETALKIASNIGQYAEVYLENTFSRGYAIEQGISNAGGVSQYTGMRIRIIKNKRLYTISTNSLNKSSISKLLSKNNFYSFKGINTQMSDEGKAINAKWNIKEKKNLDYENFYKDLQYIDNEMSKNKSIKFRAVYANSERKKTIYLNSEGTKIESEVPRISSFISIIIGNGKDTRQRILSIGSTGGYEVFNAQKISSDIESEAKELLYVMEKGINIPADKIKSMKNVVISPEITGIAVHESIGHPNEADRVFGREAAQAGTSYITKDNIGLEIGNKNVNIIDNPSLFGFSGTFKYDDEGVKTKPITIVKNGIQNQLLTNREYANILGLKSTASARSESYSGEPIVRMSNTYVAPGDVNLDELISEAKDGVYMKNYTEWNIDDTRSFSKYQGAAVYLIKNGRISQPVKNFYIEKTTLEFWHAVKFIGKEIELFHGDCGKGEPLQGVPVSMGGPAMLLSFR
jgi:TldD protein